MAEPKKGRRWREGLGPPPPMRAPRPPPPSLDSQAGEVRGRTFPPPSSPPPSSTESLRSSDLRDTPGRISRPLFQTPHRGGGRPLPPPPPLKRIPAERWSKPHSYPGGLPDPPPSSYRSPSHTTLAPRSAGASKRKRSGSAGAQGAGGQGSRSSFLEGHFFGA